MNFVISRSSFIVCFTHPNPYQQIRVCFPGNIKIKQQNFELILWMLFRSFTPTSNIKPLPKVLTPNCIHEAINF